MTHNFVTLAEKELKFLVSFIIAVHLLKHVRIYFSNEIIEYDIMNEELARFKKKMKFKL